MDSARALFDDPEMQGSIGLAIIVGAGLSMVVLVIQHALQTTVGVVDAVFLLTPLVLSSALVVTGILLWWSRFDGPEMLRIGGWVFVGMFVFGLLVTWIVTHEQTRGQSVTDGSFVTVASVSVGGFFGLIIGWLDARKHRYERELEREGEKLQTQIDQLDEFASLVSHDLRNPLNVAILHLETVRAKTDDPAIEPSLDDIDSSLDRMERIIQDLLTMAREGRVVEETELVSLSDVARDVWTNVATGEARLALDSDCRFEADRGGLEHVLENLFRNAIEHGVPATATTPEADSRGRDAGASGQALLPLEDGGGSPAISVRVGALADGFFVEDDGVGIDDDIADSVFESGVTTSTDGTGFGLQIVEKIGTAHGWTVTATESGDGGARFEVRGIDSLT